MCISRKISKILLMSRGQCTSEISNSQIMSNEQEIGNLQDERSQSPVLLLYFSFKSILPLYSSDFITFF